MRFLRNIKKVLAGAVSGIMLFNASYTAPAANVSAASDVTVDLSKSYQTIRGFGGINHPEWAGDLTAAQRQTAFGNGSNELGLTILRIFVNPDKNQWNKAVPTALDATKRGDVTIFASPWEPPSNLVEKVGSNTAKVHLPKKNYGAYAEHLNNFGNYMKQQGVNLYAVSIQNEPDYAKDWTRWSTDEATDFIANYADKITSTKVMSPESFQYSPENASWIANGDGGKKYYKKILANAKAFANTDVFGTHFYGTSRNWMDFPELEKCGKEIWMTEVYVPNSDANSANRWPEGVKVAENIHNAMVVSNMSAYTWWYIRRSYSLLTEDGKPSKRGYAMAQYSKWVRPGYVRVDATEQPENGVYVSAYKGGGDKTVIVAVNTNSSEYNKNFTIKNATIKNVDRYRTSQNENLAPTLNMNFSGSTFNAQLPANSVSTFVVTLSGASGIPSGGPSDNPVVEQPLTPDSNGYYFHDTFEDGDGSWTSHGTSTLTISGRTPYAGTEAMLVQEREKAWNGAEKALGSATFTAGKEYSFSVNAISLEGDDDMTTFFLKLQYKNSSGETSYAEIARGTSLKGSYVQLANTNYKIPDGATDLKMYVETETGTDNFYIDEAIVAVAGTKINGPSGKLPIPGDVNLDGNIDSFDVLAARKGIASGKFASSAAEKAADVDGNGKSDSSDLLLIHRYVLRATPHIFRFRKWDIEKLSARTPRA